MKVKNLKQEIKSILASIGNNFGKDTVSVKKLTSRIKL